jgi:hypothetical protein
LGATAVLVVRLISAIIKLRRKHLNEAENDQDL